jgi:ABC-type branched-subunit amino acid transport system ATPase component
MSSTLELKNFRGLEHVKFENLGRANLIVGGNNAGKTSILEGLAILYGNRTQLTELPGTFRAKLDNAEMRKGYWRELRKFGVEGEFEIKADTDRVFGKFEPKSKRFLFRGVENPTATLGAFLLDSARYSPLSDMAKPSIPASIVSTHQIDPIQVSELFAQVGPINAANEDAIELLLARAVDSRLVRLRYARQKDSPTNLVHADLGEGPMSPFTVLGQAFIRILYIYCEIFANSPKILLIDEIENGLYYEGMEDFWKGLMAVLEDQDVQLFATTHSRECMEAAQKAASAMDGDPLRFLRLDRRLDDPGKIVATTFGKEEMQTAIEFNREMR